MEHAEEKVAVKCVALMTAPRYENTWCRNYIDIATREAGVPLSVSLGVFYGQCMQKMLLSAIAAKTDFAITIDFDSVFTAAHIHRLLSLIVSRPEIDAVCGFQARRGASVPLGTKKNTTGIHVDPSEPLRLNTAHFGLTVLRLSSLQKVQLPWFWSRPDKSGHWENDKLDDDIYFWRKWEEAGNTIYMDSDCRIGHMEEVISQFVERDGQYVVEHVYPCDWKAQNGY